jgi:very-short-patch-repair endonuclease
VGAGPWGFESLRPHWLATRPGGTPGGASCGGVWSPDPNNSAHATTPPDVALSATAARQHGVVSRAQLHALGLDAKAIGYRLSVGRLHLLHRRVYAVGHVPRSMHAHAMAAVLACGPDAVLSHRSAAALWRIDPTWRTPIEVTATSKHRLRGVLVHRSRTLDPRDITTRDGIPVTTPARTLVDLADVLDDLALARAVNEAQVLRLTTLDAIADLLDRSPGRRAVRRLAPFVEQLDAPTRSIFEDTFKRFIERHDLPRPELNQTVAGCLVDAVWREQRLVVELDSRQFHDHDQPFERDRDNDAKLLLAGYRVLRITWRRLTKTPEREAARIRALLTGETGLEPATPGFGDRCSTN